MNPADGFRPYEPVTPNQVVAYNLARARSYRRWTQDQAREALAPYLGVKWSKASYSSAERSMDGVRIRQFDADEIVAFARAFKVPIVWFFMPPDPAAADGIPIRLSAPDLDADSGGPMGELIELVYGDDEMKALMLLIVERLIQGYGHQGQTEAHRVIENLAAARKRAIVTNYFGDIHNSARGLRNLAGLLEDLALQAGTATFEEIGLDEDYPREPRRYF